MILKIHTMSFKGELTKNAEEIQSNLTILLITHKIMQLIP